MEMASVSARTPTLLQKSRFLETEETSANDDVIQEIDLKNLCSGH